MGIFKSNRQDMGGSQDVPLDQVAAMKQQGYSNNQIIQTLQRDGYSSTQIFDAISQAELSTSQPDADYSGINPQTQQLGQQLPLMQPMQQMQPSIPPMQSSIPPMQSMSSMQSAPMSDFQSSPEELIEAIIEEKWNELVKDINRVIEWKQKADAKLSAMDQRLDDMQAQFDKLHQAIIGKVGDYDKHILDVGTQLQAMEKVFGKVLPEFIDNVNELSIITQRVKADSRQVSSKPFKRVASKKGKDEEDE